MRIHKLLAGTLVSFLVLSLSVIPHALGGSDVDEGGEKFTDVSEKHAYIKAIEHLRSEEIVEGYKDGNI